MLLGCLIEVVLEFSRILVVKRDLILDISFLIPALRYFLAQNLSIIGGLVDRYRVTPLHELIDVILGGVVLSNVLEELLMSQGLLLGIGALILLVKLLRLQNVRVLNLRPRLILVLLYCLQYLELV